MESVPSTDPTGNREPTTGESEPESASLRRVRTMAHLMDDAFRVPGTDFRIGLDPIVGILPVIGDSVAMLFSLYIVLEAAIAGVPKSTLARMLAVVAVDAVIGSVPVLGPIFDAVWKANVWNAQTIERHVAMADQPV